MKPSNLPLWCGAKSCISVEMKDKLCLPNHFLTTESGFFDIGDGEG